MSRSVSAALRQQNAISNRPREINLFLIPQSSPLLGRGNYQLSIINYQLMKARSWALARTVDRAKAQLQTKTFLIVNYPDII